MPPARSITLSWWKKNLRTVMVGLREVIESKGLFCAMYSNRGSQFFITRKAGEKVDPHQKFAKPAEAKGTASESADARTWTWFSLYKPSGS